MNTKRYLALVMALVMVFSLVVPASAVETLPQDGDVTAKLTVSARVQGNDDPQEAAVGTIFSNMNAQLVLHYGSYLAQNTVNIVGQTKTHANQTTLSLGGTAGDGINFSEANIGTYFPGLDRLDEPNGYAIQFVDALSTSNTYWDYNLSKATDTDIGVTLNLAVIPTGNETPSEAQDNADTRWQTLKNEAFDISHDNQPENSYIKLAAGSYLQMDTEKLTVNSDLLLDDFSTSVSVDANVTNAKAKLTYTNNSTTAYQLLLKEGTQFSLGHSIAQVKRDLLVTMSNVTKEYEASILGNVYNKLDKTTEEDLAKNLLVVFSEIAGLARPADTEKPVKITFGTPNSTTTEEGNTTVITTTTENAAGTTDVTTVETTKNTVKSGETTTVTETVTTTSSTVTKENTSTQIQEEYTVKVTSQKVVTTTTYENDVQTDQSADVADSTDATVPVTIKVMEADSNVDNLRQLNGSVNIADAELNNLTSSAKAALVTEAVTKAQEALQAQDTVVSVAVYLAIVAEAKNSDSDAENQQKKTYEVKPVITTTVSYSGSETPAVSSSTVSNDSLQGNFEIKLPVPAAIAAPGSQVKVTHISDGYDPQVSTRTVAEDGTVTIIVTHFSQFDLEPVTAAEAGTAKLFYNLTLSDTIAINVKVKQLTLDPEHYTVTYSYNGEDEKSVRLDTVASETEGSAKVYPITVAECAAKEMVDTVSVTLFCDGVQCVDTKNLSIRSYCQSVINDANANEGFKTLCKAVLNYGASAQNYFNYKTDSLANAGIDTGNIPDAVPDEYIGYTANGAPSITHKVNLSLESKTELNFKLKNGDSTNLSNISVKDITAEPNQSWQYTVSSTNDPYTVKVTGIPAKHLNHNFELTYTYGGDTYSITYSPLAYARAGFVQGNDNLSKMCRALYGYWYAAKDYLPNN